jgi:hypothetical protein
MTDTTALPNLIGTRINHGSPGYMNEETVATVEFLSDRVEIEFESGCFTQMKPEEFEYMMQYQELFYNEMTHNGLSQIVFA